MRIPAVVATAVVAVMPAMAATLAPDSIVCESREDLALLDRPNLRGQPGSVVMQRVRSGARLSSPEVSAMLERSAALSRSGTVAQRIENKRDDADMHARFASFEKGCLATSSAQPAIVLERKAISGAARIQTPINGMQAEVWTTVLSLSD